MREVKKFALLVLVASLAGCASIGMKDYDMGKRHLEHGEYMLALRAFEMALERNPDFARDGIFQEKLLAVKVGRARELFLYALNSTDYGALHSQVKRNLEDAATLDPNSQEIQNALKTMVVPEAGKAGEAYAKGVKHYDNKDWYKADACFTQAIELSKEHIPARLKRFECKRDITKADENFWSAIRLIGERKLGGATANLENCVAISPFHPEADKVLKEVKTKKAEAQKIYRKGIESARKAAWKEAEKAFVAAVDIWSDYQEALENLAEACVKQADIYEGQNLPGHALIKCVMALERVPDYEDLDERARDLRDRLVESVTFTVGLIVEDAGGDGRKAGKVEAAVLSAQRKSWPGFLRVSTMAELKIAAISPEYLVWCKVLELEEEKDKSVETKSERVKVGRKKYLNPKYVQYKKELEQLDPRCLAAIYTAAALQGTPEYVYEDVYETRHHVITTYHYSASISLNTRITEPATATLIDSVVLSDNDAETSEREYGVDLLSPLTQSTCEQVCQKVAFWLAKAHSEKLLDAANKSVGEGQTAIGVENCVKVLLTAPERATEEMQEAKNNISKHMSTGEFDLSLFREEFTSSKLFTEGRKKQAQPLSSKTNDRAYLGVGYKEMSPKLARIVGLTYIKGLLITEVVKNSAAEKAGLKQNDIIVEVDSSPVTKRDEFRNHVKSLRPGTDVQIVVLRGGNPKILTVELGQWPEITSFIPEGIQTRILLYDDFSDNQNRWSESSNTKRTIEVRNGKYFFSHKRNTGRWSTWKTIDLSPEDDFMIECQARHIDGVDNYGYGLMLARGGTHSPDNVFQFTVSNHGSFNYNKLVDGEWKNIIGWNETSRSFYKKNVFNRLSVIRKGKKIRFFVNGYRVGEAQFEPFSGKKFGFVVYNRQSIEFDDFVVKVFK